LNTFKSCLAPRLIVLRSLQQVLERLADPEEAAKAATALQMDICDFNQAARSLREAAIASWPTTEFPELPPPGSTCSM
jgi:class 3 adenylate cyclase